MCFWSSNLNYAFLCAIVVLEVNNLIVLNTNQQLYKIAGWELYMIVAI
jgi:hypothetical protein